MSRYIKRCSYCGEKFSLFFYDYVNYCYKVKKNNKYIYQCSYPCYCKELCNENNKLNSNRK